MAQTVEVLHPRNSEAKRLLASDRRRDIDRTDGSVIVKNGDNRVIKIKTLASSSCTITPTEFEFWLGGDVIGIFNEGSRCIDQSGVGKEMLPVGCAGAWSIEDYSVEYTCDVGGGPIADIVYQIDSEESDRPGSMLLIATIAESGPEYGRIHLHVSQPYDNEGVTTMGFYIGWHLGNYTPPCTITYNFTMVNGSTRIPIDVILIRTSG